MKPLRRINTIKFENTGTLINDDLYKIKYKRIERNFIFSIYEPSIKKFIFFKYIKYKCISTPLTMSYLDFIDYLYKEKYLTNIENHLSNICYYNK
jgi:hypothetical protein